MATAVDIFLKDDSLSNLPIQSAVVSVYDNSTMALVGQAVSDSTGRAAFLLPGATGAGTVYEVRAFKLGVIFGNPARVAVVEPVVTTNIFDITGTLLDLPIATDPRVCRCTGRFVGFSNEPVSGLSLRISALTDSGTQTPKVVDGRLVSPDTRVITTDSNGMLSVDLLRGGLFYVTFSGEEDVVRMITVPDRLSANLVDLIHPAPSALFWDQTAAPGNAINVQVGQFVPVNYTVALTDYRVVGAGNSLQNVIRIFNSAPTIMDAAAGDAVVVVLGLAPGAGQVTASIVTPLSPVRVPTPTLAYLPLNVNVVL